MLVSHRRRLRGGVLGVRDGVGIIRWLALALALAAAAVTTL